MPTLSRLGIGAIVFLVGACIYIINLVMTLSRRGKPIPVEAVGLMVLGIGLMLLKW